MPDIGRFGADSTFWRPFPGFQAHIGCAVAQSYFPPWSSKPGANCSAADQAKIAAYGAGWFADFAGLLAAPTVAVFATACIAHEERGTAGWTTLKAGGVVLRDAFAQWHRGLDAAEGTAAALPAHQHWIDNCPLPCNANRQVCAPLT